MLFNSYLFMFAYIPLVLLGFYLCSHYYPKALIPWLVVSSFFFYGFWYTPYLIILTLSILFNFSIGKLILFYNDKKTNRKIAKSVLIFGIFANLAALGYYKYSNFFIDNVNHLLRTNFNWESLALPLGISFFTFTQIAYLVDTFDGKALKTKLNEYLLFVTWFPHLIAGPLLHHKEMISQFSKFSNYKINWDHLTYGTTLFIFGLAKKVILADNLASYVSDGNPLSIFTKAGQGIPITFVDGWIGALTYTLQLYFDFSGYTDMAVGLSFLFGIKFPINFNSPYKAINISDFWRRWHITLSFFLRDYLYIRLGGSRISTFRTLSNLFITMLLGGLWHGAGFTFIAWGMLHGIYLIINHGWKQLTKASSHLTTVSAIILNRFTARMLTFIAVVVAWVIFRCHSISAAGNIISGMFGFHGIALAQSDKSSIGFLDHLATQLNMIYDPHLQMSIGHVGMWIIAGLFIVWFLPNTYQIMNYTWVDAAPTKEPLTKKHRLQWKPTWQWLIICVGLFTCAFFQLTKPSEFLYFQF